jgi:hypothetical protein
MDYFLHGSQERKYESRSAEERTKRAELFHSRTSREDKKRKKGLRKDERDVVTQCVPRVRFPPEKLSLKEDFFSLVCMQAGVCHSQTIIQTDSLLDRQPALLQSVEPVMAAIGK